MRDWRSKPVGSYSGLSERQALGVFNAAVEFCRKLLVDQGHAEAAEALLQAIGEQLQKGESQ